MWKVQKKHGARFAQMPKKIAMWSFPEFYTTQLTCLPQDDLVTILMFAR